MLSNPRAEDGELANHSRPLLCNQIKKLFVPGKLLLMPAKCALAAEFGIRICTYVVGVGWACVKTNYLTKSSRFPTPPPPLAPI